MPVVEGQIGMRYKAVYPPPPEGVETRYCQCSTLLAAAAKPPPEGVETKYCRRADWK